MIYYPEMNDGQGHKRKRGMGKDVGHLKKPRVTRDTSVTRPPQAEITLLETQILESNTNLNNIVSLQKKVDDFPENRESSLAAAVALCRVFCRLVVAERLIKSPDDSHADIEIGSWLRTRLSDYVHRLASWIGSSDGAQDDTAVTLLMRLVKAEVTQDLARGEQAWRNGKLTFSILVSTLLRSPKGTSARQKYAETYMQKYDDVRFYTLSAIKNLLSTADTRHDVLVGNALDLLSVLKSGPESNDKPKDWYGKTPSSENRQLLSPTAYRKVAQECWLSIFHGSLPVSRRNTILQMMTDQILPHFSNRMEALTDFLSDSFTMGGSTSLLALAGLFHLMTERNLDYPEFYRKLYSLLDEDILHSKHRGRFFRLFDQFMRSSHLPAALVASFVKRLARLSLKAPPGAIVWILPWTYNVLKAHPPCTFMLHRPYHPGHHIYSSHPNYEDDGMDDVFDHDESDPMNTRAIESSLWELLVLREHWHPNVATLAQILAEQFTKREYQLEDFLDHSYTTLIDSELSKMLKKKPEVEWEIPKRIVTTEDRGLNSLGISLQAAISA